MENPNLMALELVDEAIDFADELNVGVRHLENEAAVLDFGLGHRGGVEAGLLLVEVATGGLATVQARLGTVDGAALTHVELSTDHPRRSLLACQSPGWALDVDGVSGRGSGPAQLSREDGESGAFVEPDAVDHDELGFEDADFAILVVESPRQPREELVETVATEAGVPTSGVFVLVAPAASVAGSVANAALTAERAVTAFADTGHDARLVRSVTAAAPVAPLARSEADARIRSAAAIGHGGRVHLVVEEDVDRPERLVLGEASIEEGEDLPAPAQVTLDVVGGPTRVVGGVDESSLGDRLGL